MHISSSVVSPRRTWVQAGCLAVFLWLAQPRSARAENSLTYQYTNYAEADNRIQVKSNSALANVDIGTDNTLKVMGVTDSVAGATPTGERAATVKSPVPVSWMTDHRKAVNADFAHQFSRVNVDVGYGQSTESDYTSRGWSLNTVTNFNQKSTLMLLGLAGTNDTIHEPILGWGRDRSKTGLQGVIGVTQVLTPDDTLTANLTIGHQSGYLNDPYKLVSTTMLYQDTGTYYTVPENRPRDRNQGSLYLGSNHNFSTLDGALETSYRLYHDSWGVTSHTLGLRWLQNFGEHVVLEPSLRYMYQSAADFYHYNLDAAGVVTRFDATGETGSGSGPYYSSDYRLSRLHTVDLGIKVTWKVMKHLSVDVSYDSYTMRGLDSLTPKAVYPDAHITTAGIKLTF